MTRLETAPVLPGEILAGKYRIERLLGKGGMGIVVAARHIELEERVAIKFLIKQNDPVAVERFMREARAAAKVKSEHVCRVFDVGRLDTGEPYLVMEYLEGADLAAKLASEGQVRIADIAGWMIETCAALSPAHALGIVHRDLKPANLFLAKREDGSICLKVLDFGISKLPDVDAMTSTTMTMGSPVYMSPEQINSARDVDARSDIWSLGVIMHELVSRKVPFVAETLVQLTVKIREAPAPSLSTLVDGVPPGFEAIVDRCLEKAASSRYQNVGDLAAALAPFAEGDAVRLAGRVRERHSGSPPGPAQAASPAGSDPALAGTMPEVSRAASGPPPSYVPAARPAAITLDPSSIPSAAPSATASSSTSAPLENVHQVTLEPLSRASSTEAPRSRWLAMAAAITAAVFGVGVASRNCGPSEKIVSAPDVSTSLALVPSAPSSTAPLASAAPSASTAPSASAAQTASAPSVSASPSSKVQPASAAKTTTAPIKPADAGAAPSMPEPPPSANVPPPGKTKRSLDRTDPYER